MGNSQLELGLGSYLGLGFQGSALGSRVSFRVKSQLWGGPRADLGAQARELFRLAASLLHGHHHLAIIDDVKPLARVAFVVRAAVSHGHFSKLV